MKTLIEKLREQGTHSGIILLVVVLLIARLNGVAPSAITEEVAEMATAIATLSALAKGFLKG